MLRRIVNQKAHINSVATAWTQQGRLTASGGARLQMHAQYQAAGRPAPLIPSRYFSERPRSALDDTSKLTGTVRTFKDGTKAIDLVD